MSQPEDRSKLRWHDAFLILAVISVLAVAFLYQIALRSGTTFPPLAGEHEVESVTTAHPPA